MIVSKTHIDWAAHIAAQSVKHTRQRLHTVIAKRDGGAQERFLRDRLSSHHLKHSRRAFISGGTMARPVSLDNYDA
jgi:hypothetical protein